MSDWRPRKGKLFFQGHRASGISRDSGPLPPLLTFATWLKQEAERRESKARGLQSWTRYFG